MNANEEMKCLSCVMDGKEQPAFITLSELGADVVITLRLPGYVIQKRGENYFDTLVQVRIELEDRGILLLCKGCCRNVYPSAMMLSMGTGEIAYTLTMGEPARRNSIVNIFDPCTQGEYATVKEQKAFAEAWFKSIGDKNGD